MTSTLRKILRNSVSLVLAGAVVSPLFGQNETERLLDYQIGPRDLVSVRVVQDPTLNTEARVNDEGQITMPLLGAVLVRGLTPGQAGARIKGLLEARYITSADVIVSIREFVSQPVSVVGAVSKPGPITISGNMTLVQAISAAGGMSSNHGPVLYVLRTARNGLTEQLEIDIQNLLVAGDPDLNIPIAPNDVINIPAETPLTVYVLGEVMKPGAVEFKRSQNATLLQAIAGSGGWTDRANRRRLVVKRRDGIKEETIQVDLREILSGKKPDFVLRENDTILVRESIF